jgi:Xaa-Pro aminopeptidase
MTWLSDEGKAVHRRRREALLARLPEGSVAVFPAAPAAMRNGDVEHEYRQDSDVWYLTGYEEPEAVVVLRKGGEGPAFEMVVRPRDPERETWEGRRAGLEGAKAVFGAEESHDVKDLDEVLAKALAGRQVLVYALGANPDMDRRLVALWHRFRVMKRKGPDGPKRLEDPAAYLHELRLVKDEADLVRLQRACDVTVEGHKAAMRATRAGLTERHVQAVVDGTFRALGSPRNGYGSIVAGGANATILHYRENQDLLPPDGLLLIDAGAEVDGYTSDITRTFPVSGRFTPAQREIYDVVLRAQLASIEATVPGRTIDEVHMVSVRVLTEGLVQLGFLQGDASKLVEEEKYKKWYMHRTGHWLGMDVHDAGGYREADGSSRKLVPGMVTTVEPGLYVAPDDQDAPERFRGIGIRIEDDVLVTSGAPRVLTAACPKSVRDIEATMAEPAPAFPTLP